MHRVVSRQQWLAERQQLLNEEKEFTRRRDALAEKRRALPWVWVRPNNMYGKGGEVAPNGRFTPPVSCCM